MRVAVLALLAVHAAGCSFGFGSAYVGQWRAHREVDFEVCVEDDAGRCRETRQVTRDFPARHFWGVDIAWPNLGASLAEIEGARDTSVRLEGSMEILRGFGGRAIGFRSSVIWDAGDTGALSFPVTALYHVGFSERFSAYGGLGWSPYTRLVDKARDLDTVSRSVVRGVAGLQIVINRSHRESRFLWAIEVDHMRALFGDTDYQSFGLMSHLGVSI